MAVTATKGGMPGYVFCLRVADHPTPLFRYVGLPADGDDPMVIDDTLACLDRARPGGEWDTERVLTQVAYDSAFDAWELATVDVVETWNRLADPANLAPVVPAVMRRAAETVREHAKGLEVEVLDRTVAAIEAPYAERILRMFRSAMAIEVPGERAAAIVELVDELGLEPPPAPDPLPEITADDVNVVCWMALVPDGS